MPNSTKLSLKRMFDREHMLIIIGTLLVSLHMVESLVRGEELAPPFIPLVIVAVLYSFLPLLIRAPLALALGAMFFYFALKDHILPSLDRGPMLAASDYTSVFPLAGGILLVVLSVRLLKERLAQR